MSRHQVAPANNSDSQGSVWRFCGLLAAIGLTIGITQFEAFAYHNSVIKCDTCPETDLGDSASGNAGTANSGPLGYSIAHPSPPVSSGGVDVRVMYTASSDGGGGGTHNSVNETRVQEVDTDGNGSMDAAEVKFGTCPGPTFDLPGFTPPPGSPLKIEENGDTLTVRDPSKGLRWEFEDFDGGSQRTWHLVEKSIDGVGSWTFNRDGNNNVTSIVNGAMTMTTTLSGNNLSSVTVKRSGAEVRKTEYTYASGSSRVTQVIEKAKDTSGVWRSEYRQFRYDGTRPKAVYESADIVDIINNTSITNEAGVLAAADSTIQDYASERVTYTSGNPSTSSVSTPWESSAQDLEWMYGCSSYSESSQGGALVATKIMKGTGGGGCCGGGSGNDKVTESYHYMANSGDSTLVVVIDTKDANNVGVNRRVYGLNEDGYTTRMATITDPLESDSGTKYWCRSWAVNGDNMITEVRHPSAHDVAEQSDFEDYLDGDTTLNASSGKIDVLGYDSNDNLNNQWVKKGAGGTPYYVSATDYDLQNRTTASYRYPTKTTSRTAGEKTQQSYTHWNSTTDERVKVATTSHPLIATSKNGSNSQISTYQYYDNRGRLAWTKDGEGYVNYYAYRPDSDDLAYTVIDANPNSLPSSANANPTKWNTWTAYQASSNKPSRGSGLPTALQLVSTKEYDGQGRVIKRTDPDGAEHRTVYKDNQTLEFPYWSTSNRQPIEVMNTDDSGRVLETITVSPAYVMGGSSPTGFYDYQSGYISWSTSIYGSSGELTESRTYHNIPNSGNGSEGTNYYSTKYKYDDQGRTEYTIQYVESGRWQWTQNVYDDLGRSIEVRKKVHTSSTSIPSMTTVSRTVYDDQGVGDGHVTHQLSFHGTSGTANTGNKMYYNYRGQARGSHGISAASVGTSSVSATNVSPYNVVDLDWEGNSTANAVYSSAPNWTTITGGDGNTTYAATNSSNRKRLSKTYYDDWGRLYRSETYKDSYYHLKTDRYYNRNGQIVAIAPAYAAATELAYDGAGRQYQTRTVTSLNSTKYSGGAFVYQSPVPKPTLSSMSGGNDSVLEMSHQAFDLSGNGTESHTFEINHNDTNGISITGSDYVRRSVYSWHDAANRLTHTADYGSGTGSHWKHNAVPTRPSSGPSASSSSFLVTRQLYDSNTGRLERTIDPKGTVTKNFYDDMGRTTFVSSNWKNFNGSSYTGGTDKSEDATVKTVYNGLSNVSQLIALDKDGNGNQSDNEVTKYYYRDNYDASLATHTVYPDSSSTWNSGDDKVTMTYLPNGQVASREDQRGTKLEYQYDTRRNVTLEKVASLGGADSYVQSIKRTYDSLGQLDKLTSYASNNGSGTIRNEIKYQYNYFGNVTRSYQDHNGAYSSSSPNVRYYFDTSSSSYVYTDGYRPQMTIYPSGRRTYQYSFGTVNDALHRVTHLRNNHRTGSYEYIVDYQYNGTSRLVRTNYRQPSTDVISTMDTSSGAGYEGWDRFGRTVTKQWFKGSTQLDKYTHGYDYVSSRTSRTNHGYGSLSHGYNYDGGHRLTSYTEGGGGTEQSWTLDAWGNWSTFKYNNNATTQTRVHNNANETTSISNWSNPTHDAVGNMTSVPNPSSPGSGLALKYDAWNRLVQAGATTYRYDGKHRRIEKLYVFEPSEHYYYNTNWQCIEVRTGSETGTRKEAYVWHPHYIDALAARYWDSNDNGNYTGTDEAHYALHDANNNVTALINTSGDVRERYHYSAYGELTVLDPSWATDSDSKSDFENPYTYTGRKFDQETGMYQYRNRYFHAELGRFVSRDPIVYQGGQWNIYAYLAANPLVGVDPLGLYNPLTGEGFPHKVGRPNNKKQGDGLNDKLLDLLIGLLEKPGKPRCMAMCLVLDMTEEDIRKLLQDLQRNLPAALRAEFMKQLYSRPGDAAFAFLTLLKALRSKIRIAQGTGIIGKPLKDLLGDKVFAELRRKLAKILTRKFGKGGRKVLGKLGTKLVPGVGWGVAAIEACNVGRCVKACGDNRYRWDESAFETQVWVFQGMFDTISKFGQHSHPRPNW